MDQLCQRLVSYMPMNGYYGEGSYDGRSPGSPGQTSDHSGLQRYDSHASNASRLAGTSSRYPNVATPDQSQIPQISFQHMQSARHVDGSIRRTMSQGSHTASYDWSAPRVRQPPMRGPSIQEEAENEAPTATRHSQIELDRISELSLRDSAIGSDSASKHKKAPSINSLPHSDPQRPSSVSDRSTNDPGTSSNARQQVPWIDDLSPESSETSSISSRTRAGLPSATINFRLESIDDESRAMYAPELVTRGFESMLSQNSVRPVPYSRGTTQSANVHPALRVPEDIADSPSSPEPDHAWSPLPRPAKHNNYHGFCKGAWQTRKAVRIVIFVLPSLALTDTVKVQEGLSIRMVPNAEGNSVPHWTCKLCQFGSRALNRNALPDQVYFNSKCGVRYRWLFLAKSHIPAVGSM